MRTLSRYILFIALVALTGCAATPPQNYLAPDLPPDSLTIIADDITPEIVAGNPAKSNSFIVPGDDFGKELADNLRKLGYEVSHNQTDQSEHAEVIRYTIDRVSPDSLYIALTVNNSQRYTRSYTVDRNDLTPEKTLIKGHNDER